MISVIVPVRNGMPLLEEQLRALAAQECVEPWEVVVADNGSTDGTLAFARDWAETHTNVLVVDASGLVGASAARNAGVAVARGEYLAFCDADDVVLAGWLAACVEALRTADLVAGRFDFWSLNSMPPTEPVRAATRQLGFLPAGLGANLAVRRAPFEEVGGFDEHFVPGEDIDLCWRMQLRGFTFAEAPGAVVAKRARSDFRRGVPAGLRLRAVRPAAPQALPKGRGPSRPAGRAQGMAVAGRVAAPAGPADPPHRVGTWASAPGSAGWRPRSACGSSSPKRAIRPTPSEGSADVPLGADVDGRERHDALGRLHPVGAEGLERGHRLPRQVGVLLALGESGDGRPQRVVALGQGR